MTQHGQAQEKGIIAGVDGYPGGWIAAIELGNGSTRIEEFATFSALLAREDLKTIVIDVPIGLLAKGPRSADLLARKRLGKRASSVFPAPSREMLKAVSWETACRVLFESEQKKCSKQGWGILPKIREVDAEMNPSLQERVLEGHPEVSFTLMNGCLPMAHPKRRAVGRAERRQLLEREFRDVRDKLEHSPKKYITDVIDAYACLWTARRAALGTAIHLPSEAELDERGLRAEIVA